MAQIHKIFRLKWLILIISFSQLIFISCAHYGDWGKRISWKDIEFTEIPGVGEFPEAGAIILSDKGKMEIIGGDKIKLSIFERHRIIKILNSRGYQYANIVIPYDSESKVKQIQARTISADGEITVLDHKNIYDVSLYPNFIFYSDQRAKLFTMPAVENGSIIEYRYEIDISGLTFWHSWEFQEEVPTLLSRFTLVAPSEWEVKYQVYGIEMKPTIKKVPSGFKSTYIWEARDIPAFKSEFGMPPKKELTARLALAPIGIKTWQDIVQWYYKLSNPRLKAGKKIKELVHSLTDSVESKEEKLRLIYECVRDQIRYIAVSIGIGGYQPHPAEEVLLNKYGDCKDIATLLCSMAHEAGVDANEALISTHQNGRPDTSLPSFFHFNHVIAYCPSIGDSGVWMDASDKGCPYGELPWYDQGLPILIVDEKSKGKILTTPQISPESNRTNVDWRVKFTSNASAIIQGETVFCGPTAIELRNELYRSKPIKRKEWLELYLANRFPFAALDSFQFSGLNPLNDSLSVHYIFHTKSHAGTKGKEVVFNPGEILGFDLPNYFRSPSRSHPIQFRYGFTEKLNLEINLPDDWEWETSASSDSITSEFGQARFSFKGDCNKIILGVEFTLNGKQITPEQYTHFQNFLDSIKDKISRAIILEKKLKL